MTSAEMRPLVVKVTAGAEEPERCSQGFTVAAAAVSAGAQVSLWLTGEAVWLATPGRAETFELLLAAPLESLLEQLLTSGSVTVCTQCAARRSLGPANFVEGVRISGAASYVEEILRPDAQAVVY